MLESPVSDLLGRMDLEAIDSPLLVIGAGLLLLAFGRRLYWLLVGLAGFVAGYYLTVRYLDLGAGAVPLILGVVAGLICGTVVVLFQKLAVAVVGFLAAGVAMLHIAATLELAAGYWVLIVAVVAGVIGALLARSLFELVLIVSTSLAGATLVVMTLGVAATTETVILVALTGLGVLVQLSTGRKRKAKS